MVERRGFLMNNQKSKIENRQSTPDSSFILHPSSFDVIIVGGGPAGATLAALLAGEGWSVALLDRAQFPRDKACGEFLTPQAARLLKQPGVWQTLRAQGLRDVSATVLVAPDGRQVEHAPLTGEPAGYALRRTVLDVALLQHAREKGAFVEEGFGVRELCRNEDGRVIGVAGRDKTGEIRTLHARLIVGADGTHSLVARQLNLVKPIPRLQRIALVAHWQGDIGGRRDTIEMRTHGPLVCGLGFPGEEQSSPQPPAPSPKKAWEKGSRSISYSQVNTVCANTTFVVPNDYAPQIAGRAEEWIEQTLTTCFPDLAERLSPAAGTLKVRAVGCFGHRSHSPIADGALLVGDAATFIDPFTGEGVYFCLRGAQLAAETIHSALQKNDTSRRGLRNYAQLRQELARRYLLIDLVQTVVRTPALFNPLAKRLERFPGAAERLLQILGDTRPPEHVLHPMLLWRLFAPCF